MVDVPENPPAFPMQPVTASGEPCSPESGMTLRDYFAGQALAAYEVGVPTSYENSDRQHCASTAAWVYRIADAMLAERERQS